ncbi:MAG: hypothetical protein ACK5JT_04415 [Hyphomicrobiaceae bacterium]
MLDWIYNIIDWLLLAWFWLALLWLVVHLLPSAWQQNAVLKAVDVGAAPVIGATRAVTPRAIPDLVLPFAAVTWITVLRMVWYLACTVMGLGISLMG